MTEWPLREGITVFRLTFFRHPLSISREYIVGRAEAFTRARALVIELVEASGDYGSNDVHVTRVTYAKLAPRDLVCALLNDAKPLKEEEIAKFEPVPGRSGRYSTRRVDLEEIY